MDDECVYRLASLFPPSTLRLSSPWNLFTALEYGNIYSAARGEILYSLFCYFVIFEEMKSRMRVWKARVDKRRLPWCWRVAKRKANAGGSLKLELRRKRELFWPRFLRLDSQLDFWFMSRDSFLCLLSKVAGHCETQAKTSSYRTVALYLSGFPFISTSRKR